MTADSIERGRDPNLATISRHESLVHLFVESHCVWKEYGGHPMSNNQISALISHAIEMGCNLESRDLKARDFTGKTPLLTACQHSQYHVFAVLIRRGANVPALDNNGLGALHLLLNQPIELTKLKQGCLRQALALALLGKCDENGLSIDRGLSPTAYAAQASDGLVVWNQLLNDVGARLVEERNMTAKLSPAKWNF
jgi:hypothetical protein